MCVSNLSLLYYIHTMYVTLAFFHPYLQCSSRKVYKNMFLRNLTNDGKQIRAENVCYFHSNLLQISPKLNENHIEIMKLSIVN